jgi:hypothetical protein
MAGIVIGVAIVIVPLAAQCGGSLDAESFGGPPMREVSGLLSYSHLSCASSRRMGRSGPQLSDRRAPKARLMIGQAFAATQVVLLRGPRAVDSTLQAWSGG